MRLPFIGISKSPTIALTGTSEQTILAEVTRTSSLSAPELKIIASSEGAPDNEVTIHRLLSSVPSRKGIASVVLPLHFFTTTTVSMPVIPEEAVGKAIPYHLAKGLDKPLQDFVYDWQITRRQKDHLEITAYLFPASVFKILQSELARKQLELKYLEPDVFAAFAYLNLTGKVKDSDASLCSLVWPTHSSHAIYEGGQLKLVRSVEALQPKGPCNMDNNSEVQNMETPIPPPPIISEGESEVRKTAHFFDTDNSILEDFDLTSRDEKSNEATPDPDVAEAEVMPDENKGKPGAESNTDNLSITITSSWPDYINSISLEMIRTRDFFASIMKGSALDNVFLGGAATFIDNINEITSTAINTEILPLRNSPTSEEYPELLQTICIGTTFR